LQVYKQIKPRIARVVYTLKPDPITPQAYQLLRKESTELGFSAGKKARGFVLLRNIRSIRLAFLATEPEKKEKKKLEKHEPGKKLQSKKIEPEKKKEEKPKPLKKYTVWPPEKKDELWDLPQFVNVMLNYYDPFEDMTKTYTFTFPIFNYRAPGEDVLNVPLMLQERLKKDEEETSGTTTGALQAAGRRSGSPTSGERRG